MLPAFPNITTQIELESYDVDLEDLKSSVLSNKLVISKWIQTTEKQLKVEIKKTKSKILTESKREGNYVDEILKDKLIITSRSTKNCCAFDDDCKRPNLPYSNYCGEHIAHNKDQQLFRRCNVQSTNNDQCPNASQLESDVCTEHSTSLKENKQDSKTKRKYLRKQSKNATNGQSTINQETINNLKVRKSRKKKEDKSTNDSLGDCLAITLPMENFNIKSQPFTFHSTNPVNYSSNDLNENNFNYTDHGLINYAPCIDNPNNELNNLNQLSNLNNSEDSLVAIVNNSDLTSIPFEESELSEMLGKIGKIPEIPEDAFNDLFMDNLSTESNELRAIDNVSFNDTVKNIEPSISNQTFASSSINFKSNSNYFTPAEQNLHDGLMYNGQQEQNIDLNNMNNASSQEMICLPNNLISSTDQIKSLNDTNHFSNTICGLSNVQNSPANAYAAFNVIDYKQIQPTTYPTDLVHPNYTDSPNHFNSSSYPNCLNNFTSNHPNANQSIVNGHSNNHFDNNLLLDANYSGLLATNLSSNLNQSTNNSTSNLSYLDGQKTEAQDKKQFNLFSNCKNNKNYSSTYSNIYDDLPSFEANRVNGASLPSFSIMRKNRIESR